MNCPTGMELGEALRNTENSLVELTPLSSGTYGDTSGRALRCSLNVQAMLT
jgi:hypothetical protein